MIRGETGIWLPENQLEPLRDHIAEQKQRGGPDERRDKVRDLKPPKRHLEDAGDQRDRGAQWSGKARDENAEHAPFLDEGLAFLDQLRMLRQRPDVLHPVFELLADPVGE